jgi:dTDP-4-amino-4,6-dideoxygalactose transaminase
MIDAAVKVLEKGALSVAEEGEEFIPFEKEFSHYCGRKNAVCLSSGTAALHLAVIACGIGNDDEVIVPSNTAIPVGDVVLMVGAKPVLVDPEYDTLNIDPSRIEEKITSKTKAIMVVHMHGHPADIDPIIEIAEKHSLRIIENPTHSGAARYKGKKLPRTGLAVYSCHHLKTIHLPDGGGGGMVVTDDDVIAEDVRKRRYHGKDVSLGSYDTPLLGYNYRLSDMAAAIGRIQLRHIDEYTRNQRENAAAYTKLLEDTQVTPPVEKDYAYHAFLRYIIRAPKRDKLMQYLRDEGIGCGVFYSVPMHLQTRYMKLFGYKKGDCPITEKIKEEELGLPAPFLRERWELEYVTDKIKEFYSLHGKSG